MTQNCILRLLRWTVGSDERLCQKKQETASSPRRVSLEVSEMRRREISELCDIIRINAVKQIQSETDEQRAYAMEWQKHGLWGADEVLQANPDTGEEEEQINQKCFGKLIEDTSDQDTVDPGAVVLDEKKADEAGTRKEGAKEEANANESSGEELQARPKEEEEEEEEEERAENKADPSSQGPAPAPTPLPPFGQELSVRSTGSSHQLKARGPAPSNVKPCFRMFIGSIEDSINIKELKRNGITAIVNMCLGQGKEHAASLQQLTNSKLHSPDELNMWKGVEFTEEWYREKVSSDFIYKPIDAQDASTYDIAQHFDETHEFLRRCEREKRSVLVHCIMGINRSTCVAARYFRKRVDPPLSLKEVVAKISKQRLSVLSNKSFINALLKDQDKDKVLAPYSGPPQEQTAGVYDDLTDVLISYAYNKIQELGESANGDV